MLGAIDILHSVHLAKYTELADAFISETRAGKHHPGDGLA